MRIIRKTLFGFVAVWLAATTLTPVAGAQSPTMPSPTPADWAALAELPDFSGVWERSFGGGGGGTELSPTPEYAAIRDMILERGAEDAQTANCLPPGMPRIMGQPYPMEFLLTPGKVTIVLEVYTQVRHIYTDGRELPQDPDADFFGASVGHWEEDTLLVESVGFSPLTEIAPNLPHSGNMKIVERFTLTNPDTMRIETTVTDPEALTEPWIAVSNLARHRDWTIAEYICQENNRNFVDAEGKAGVRLD